MKIPHLSLNTYANIVPFKGNERIVYDDEGEILYKNTTEFFRGDLNWDELKKVVDKQFSDKGKIGAYCLGCSDGSEPYSLALHLKTNGNSANKFLPIKAYDCDEEIIKQAKEAKYSIFQREQSRLNRFSNNKWKDYFDLVPTTDMEIRCTTNKRGEHLVCKCTPNQKLKNDVEFQKETAMSALDRMAKNEPKIIFCRNFWIYLNNQERIDLAKKLGEKTEKGSVVVTGAFDDIACNIDCAQESENNSNGAPALTMETLMETNGFRRNPLQSEIIWIKE